MSGGYRRVREVPAECGAGKPDAFDSEQQGVYVGSLDSKEVKRLFGSEASAEDGQGNLLFMRNNTLMAQPLGLQRLETAGAAFPVAEDIAFGVASNRGVFSVSGPAERKLTCASPGSAETARIPPCWVTAPSQTPPAKRVA